MTTAKDLGDARPVPLSPSQRDFAAYDRLQPGVYLDPRFVLWRAFTVSGPLDTDALREAFAAVVRGRESLRCSFRSDAQGPFGREQLLYAEVPLKFVVRRSGAQIARRATEDDARRALRSVLTDARFDLDDPPLVAMHAVQLAQEDWVCCFVAHHMVTDDEGMWIACRLVWQAYESLISSGRSGVACTDGWSRYCDRMHSALADPEKGAKAEAFWRSFLRDSTVPEIPVRRNQPSLTGGSWLASREASIPNGDHVLANCAAMHGVFPGVVAATVFGRFFAGRLGTPRALFFQTQSARLDDTYQTEPGMMLAIVPVRADTSIPLAEDAGLLQAHLLRAMRSRQMSGAAIGRLASPAPSSEDTRRVAFQYLRQEDLPRVPGLAIHNMERRPGDHGDTSHPWVEFRYRGGSNARVEVRFDGGSVDASWADASANELADHFATVDAGGGAPHDAAAVDSPQAVSGGASV